MEVQSQKSWMVRTKHLSRWHLITHFCSSIKACRILESHRSNWFHALWSSRVWGTILNRCKVFHVYVTFVTLLIFFSLDNRWIIRVYYLRFGEVSPSRLGVSFNFGKHYGGKLQTINNDYSKLCVNTSTVTYTVVFLKMFGVYVLCNPDWKS